EGSDVLDYVVATHGEIQDLRVRASLAHSLFEQSRELGTGGQLVAEGNGVAQDLDAVSLSRPQRKLRSAKALRVHRHPSAPSEALRPGRHLVLQVVICGRTYHRYAAFAHVSEGIKSPNT